MGFYSKDKEGQDDGELEDLINEYALMKELCHKNLAKTYEVFQDSQFFYLVNEPYFGGDFTKLGKRAHDEGVSMTEKWWRRLFFQCLDGLSYLHSHALMHCDIKEENIMVAAGDSYQAPDIVLIDFGLAEAFTSTSAGASGTPGYIPPETWETEWWYPRGDIFSMGITFFQLMIGQVPNDANSIMGILQTPGDREEDAAAAQALNLPWDRFPKEMPLLLDLVRQMTQRSFMHRPSAKAALMHPWLESDSDACLPAVCLAALVGSSASQCIQEEVTQELVRANNLQELRYLQDELGTSSAGVLAIKLLQEYGVRRGHAKEFVQLCGGANGRVQCRALLAGAVHLKEQYAHQFIKDLFDELDQDKSKTLTTSELEVLLKSRAFECPYEDIDELMHEMDTNGNGIVTFSEFKQTLLKDGRIARRTEADPACLPSLPDMSRSCACW